MKLKENLVVLGVLFTLALPGSHLSFGQSPDKTFESLEHLVKMNYPPNWIAIKGEPIFSFPGVYDSAGKGNEGWSAVASFCPSSELPHEPTSYLECLQYSPVSVHITAYNLQNNTSLQQFVDGEIQRITTTNEDPLFDPKETITETNSSQISGLTITRIVTVSGDENKQAIVYAVNDNVGYEITFNAKTAKYFPYFTPTFEAMLNSFKVTDLG